MIIMGATEDFRSSTNPIKRNNFFHHNLSYHQQPFLLSVLWHGHTRHTRNTTFKKFFSTPSFVKVNPHNK